MEFSLTHLWVWVDPLAHTITFASLLTILTDTVGDSQPLLNCFYKQGRHSLRVKWAFLLLCSWSLILAWSQFPAFQAVEKHEKKCAEVNWRKASEGGNQNSCSFNQAAPSSLNKTHKLLLPWVEVTHGFQSALSLKSPPASEIWRQGTRCSLGDVQVYVMSEQTGVVIKWGR